MIWWFIVSLPSRRKGHYVVSGRGKYNDIKRRLLNAVCDFPESSQHSLMVVAVTMNVLGICIYP